MSSSMAELAHHSIFLNPINNQSKIAFLYISFKEEHRGADSVKDLKVIVGFETALINIFFQNKHSSDVKNSF